MRFTRQAVGICLALALTGCADPTDASSAAPASAAQSPAAVQRADRAPSSAPIPTSFGAERVWANGISITVAQPKSLKPSDTSFPKAPRTAVFVVTLVNGTDTTYRTSQLSVRALVDGQPAAEVLDSVQGLNGAAAAITELPPGGDTALTLAYAVPENPVRVCLVVEPNIAGEDLGATFEGNA
ncbi:hypothetical protein [Saccharothrix coeruleofusca]|uniref:DUF4352 domain-containing protein n=1 Tax=Saccharothrix coeruleofusca TaxID=33919 RepID=A0A918ED04_9PSEU|nr:hypothetical protein [Saccharothrix coeruleofusca]MBP2334002.1 hypothetical protein [Saccharothrix coeruleofusca]GGP44143.1 hypothetical protein GCM10010185_14800 [Saccharothrix coeruleofusca]